MMRPDKNQPLPDMLSNDPVLAAPRQRPVLGLVRKFAPDPETEGDPPHRRA